MDLKNLTTFIHVAELQSFTKAGEKLGYSQSTISFQIHQLENELGFPLFERINHTVTLTDPGFRLLKCAHQIQTDLQEFRRATVAPQKIEGSVRLALAASLCVSLVDRVFPALHREYPQITIECATAGTPDLLRMLNQNEADLIYAMDSPIQNINYVLLQKTQVQTHFICAPTDPLAQRDYVPMEELVQQPFLLTEKDMSYRRLMDEALAAHSLEITPVFVSGDTYLLCDLVSKGCGLSLLPDYACRPMLESGELCEVKTDPSLRPVVWAQLLHHRDKWVSDPMRIVSDYLCRYPL